MLTPAAVARATGEGGGGEGLRSSFIGEQLPALIPVLRAGPPVDLLDHGAHLGRDAGLPGEIDREPQVLAGEREREGVVEVAALQHAQHVVLEEMTGGRARQQRPAERRHVTPALTPMVSASAVRATVANQQAG